MCDTWPRHPGALGHGGDLGHGLGDPLRLVADVAGVDAAEGGDHLAEGDELVQRGVGPGGVGQAAGEADGAVLHGPGGELPHALHLRRRRLAVVPAHGRHPHVPVAHEGGHVGADALVLQAREVAVEAGPVALEAAGHGRVQGAVVGLVVPGRRRRHAAVADDLGGDPLGHGGGGAAFHQEGEVGVGVDVDEAGGDEAPGGVDGGSGRGPGEIANGGDAAVLDGHVGGARRGAGAVEEAASGDEQIVHGISAGRSGRRPPRDRPGCWCRRCCPCRSRRSCAGCGA